MTHPSIDFKCIYQRTWSKGTRWLQVLDYKIPWKANGVKPGFSIRVNKRYHRGLCICIGYYTIQYTNFSK